MPTICMKKVIEYFRFNVCLCLV